MYVCICRQITDSQIREFCRERSASLAQVQAELGLASDCGRCGKYARQIIAEANPAMNAKAMCYAA
jgi:bacterioferritin-associated ferredoxin